MLHFFLPNYASITLIEDLLSECWYWTINVRLQLVFTTEGRHFINCDVSSESIVSNNSWKIQFFLPRTLWYCESNDHGTKLFFHRLLQTFKHASEVFRIIFCQVLKISIWYLSILLDMKYRLIDKNTLNRMVDKCLFSFRIIRNTAHCVFYKITLLTE